MHYYPHHIGDFIKDTANLNDHQLATYLRMIWAYYLSETPFTDSPEDIAFAMRSDEKTVQLLLRHYFEKREDGWHQKRVDSEIAHFKDNGEKKRQAAYERWKNKGKNAHAMQMHDDGMQMQSNSTDFYANQEPITNNQEPKEEEGEREPQAAPTRPRKNGSSEPRASRIPADMTLTPELRTIAVKEGLDPERTFAQFHDHWQAAAGKNAKKLDWNAAFRVWCRRDADDGKKFKHKPPEDPRAEEFAHVKWT